MTLEDIEKTCQSILKGYSVEFCILFGSYAKETPTEKSDVDLLISTEVKGMKFYGLTEMLREGLKKRVDLLTLEQLTDKKELLKEILKDGIRIYVQE